MMRGYFLVVIGLLLASPAWANKFETAAQSAILYDMASNQLLFEKNSEQRIPTASMSKVMTMVTVFDALKSGRLKLDETLPVSEKAWRTGGSKMFVHVGDQVKVEDLVRGVIVQSGNDATIVLAEGVSGSEEEFANAMNRKAQELGMKNSNFVNSSGLPDVNHYSTAADLAKLGIALVRDYPQYYHYYSELNFTYNNITQGNRNPLLYANIGADGIKTGHTAEAGFGMIGSAIQGDRRLVMVITGLPSASARQEEAIKLMQWGFRNFKAYDLFKANSEIDRVPVWLGQKADVAAIVADDLRLTLSPEQRAGLKVSFTRQQPVAAPIARGQKLGQLHIQVPGMADRKVDVLAAEEVPELGRGQRIMAAARYLLLGHN